MFKPLIIAGLILVALGVLWPLLGKLGPWPGLGRLPGDIVIDRPNMKFYFPVTTMILLSLLLSLVMWILRR